MSYHINADERIDKAIRRIAREQIDKAIDNADGRDLEVAIHAVRKRCKMLRALIRLVRPVFPDFQNENRIFRDAARQLSSLRDATTLLETCNRVLASLDDGGGVASQADTLIKIFEHRRSQIIAEQGARKRLKSFAEVMHDARARVHTWSLEDHRFRVLTGGYRRTHKHTFEAMRTAYASPSDAHFHRWRKHVVYHRYHLALLGVVWPTVTKTMHSEARELSDLLGEDHDLAVFRSTLLDDPGSFGRADELQIVLLAIDQRRSLLQARALPLGERVAAKDCDRHVK